jgi:hypothetical protein
MALQPPRFFPHVLPTLRFKLSGEVRMLPAARRRTSTDDGWQYPQSLFPVTVACGHAGSLVCIIGS